MKLPRFEISAFGKLGKAVPALHRSKYAISTTVFLPLGIDAVRNNGLQRWPEGGWAEASRAENQAYGVWAAQDKTKSGQCHLRLYVTRLGNVADKSRIEWFYRCRGRRRPRAEPVNNQRQSCVRRVMDLIAGSVWRH